MPPRKKGTFDTIQRENWYPGSPKAATAIRRGSKAGNQYAKGKQETADRIMKGSSDEFPSTLEGNRIAKRGAASIAADTVVNDIVDRDRRDKYAKLGG